jgi:Fuc2NAc and GlcNAc transferase
MPAWIPYPTALLLSLLLTALFAWRGAQLGQVGRPNPRSSHIMSAPRGGAAIVLSTLIVTTALLLLQPPENDPLSSQPIGSALLLGLPIAFLGLVDDRRDVAARWRFLTQALVVASLLHWLSPLPGFLLATGHALPAPVLWLALWIFGVAWINAFKFMEKIDGLAAPEALFILAAGATLTVTALPEAFHDTLFTALLTVAAATLGFLVLNGSPARVALGSVGSTWLAFMIFALALLTVRAGWMNFGSWLVLGAVFVTEATVTLFVRIRNRERRHGAQRSQTSPLVGRLLQQGGSRTRSHRVASLTVSAINMAWLMPLAWAAQAWPHHNMAICLLAYIPLIGVALRPGQAAH